MEYNLDKVFYIMFNDSGIDTLIQKENNFVNVDKLECIDVDDKNIEEMFECVREHYRKNGITGILILRLRDYIRSFFEAKELLLSKSKLMHKRLSIVGKENYESLLENLLKSEKVTPKEAKYISTKIKNAVENRERKKCARRPV